MNQFYETQAGDVVDLICFNYYGNVDMTERVLEANNFLSAYSTHLPKGLQIEMPEQPSKGVKQVDVVRLWD